MKCRQGIFIVVLLLLVIITAAYAADTNSGSTTGTTSSSTSTSSGTSSTAAVDEAALVYVSNVTMTPQTFFPGDQGTVTVTLTNAGTTAIGLSHPDLLSPHLSVVDNDWVDMSFVGPGSTITYTLMFIVKPPDGTYSAMFTIGTDGGNAINYPIEITVNSNDLQAAVTSKPTSFAPEAEQNVTLTLMNTRGGEINNVVITPEGEGIDAEPATVLVPSIGPSCSQDVVFGITPHQASTLTFNISYQNGNNNHYTDVVLPINIGQDKTAAVPVLNDVVLTTTAADYDITGDITNAGITDAYGVIVNVGSPATGTGTYPVYAIGSIASDDSGSFELTFNTNDLSSVPVIISWKDVSGNDFNVSKVLDLAASPGPGNVTAGGSSRPSASTTMGAYGGTNRGGGSYGGRSSSSIFGGITSAKGGGIGAFVPLIAGSIVVVVGIVLYVKRKWIMSKLKKPQ